MTDQSSPRSARRPPSQAVLDGAPHGEANSQGDIDYWYAWVDEQAAAAYLDLAVSTLQNMRSLAKGPRYAKTEGKRGAVRYQRIDLFDWMTRGQAGGRRP